MNKVEKSHALFHRVHSIHVGKSHALFHMYAVVVKKCPFVEVYSMLIAAKGKANFVAGGCRVALIIYF